MEALEVTEGKKMTTSERKELQENIFLTAVKWRSNCCKAIAKQVGAGCNFAPSNS